MKLNRVLNFLTVLTLVLGFLLTPALAAADQSPARTPAKEMAPDPKAVKEQELADIEAGYNEIAAAWPGPDGYHYLGSMCTYNWVDITASGTSVALGDDDYDGPFDIGFDFPFYGSTYDQFYLSSNGFISFSPLTSSYLTNQCPLPNSYSPNDIIALLWDDLDPGDTDDLIYYESFDACPVGAGKCAVILYDNYHHYSSTPPGPIAGTFEAILFEDGTVHIQFLDAGAETGEYSTTGIEDNNALANYGLTYACDRRSSLTDNSCAQFRLEEIPLFDTSEKMAPAITAPGREMTYTVSIVNSGIASGTNTSLVDPIPDNTTFDRIVSPPSASYNGTDDHVEWTGTVTDGDSVDVTFVVDVDPGLACGTSITNTATITDPEAPDTVVVEAITELPLPDLSTSFKSSEPTIAHPGKLLTYTVTLVNSGGCPATGTTLKDPIPAGTEFAYSLTPGLDYDDVEDQVEWTGEVAGADQLDFTFAVTVNAECGLDITNTATITSPDIPATVTVEYATAVQDLIYYWEDFEGDDGEYTVDGGTSTWEWGVVGPYAGSRPDYPPGAHSGARAWATNLTGDYLNYEDAYLTSPTIDLSGAVNVPGYPLLLQWWQWLRTESISYDWVEVQVRGGTTNWTLLDPPGRMAGPLNLEWAMYQVDVSEFAGASDFQVRFWFRSDGSVVYPGAYVDDVALYQCTPPENLYLSPDQIEVTGCVGVTQTHTFHLFNWTGADGTFDLTYALDTPAYGTIEGPDSIYLDNETGSSFVLTLTPELCLPNNTQVLASVEADGNGYADTSYITKTAMTGIIPEWLAADETPQGTRFHAVAYYDGYIYQFGGETDWWTPTTQANAYDVAGDSWSTLTSLPSGRYGMDAVTIGDLIYIPGGSDDTDDTGDGGTFLSDLLIYDPAGDSWSSGASMPTALAYASAVAYNGKLYVIGGLDNSGSAVDTVYIYDPGTDSWSSGASMNQPRAYAAAAAAGSKIYVAGGYGGGTTNYDSMEVYDPVGDTWAAGTALPKTWAAYGDGVLHDRYFVVLNGETVEYNAVDGTTYACSTDAYIYDTQTHQWEALPALNRCLYGSQGAAAGSSFYLVSGRTNDGGVWQMATQVEYLTTCPACENLGWLEGTVYDYDGIGGVCTDATVYVEPGGLQIGVDASGYYTAAVVPFDYQVTASAEGYPLPDGPYPVTVADGLVTSRDFVLDRADIEVEPLSLTAQAVSPATATQYFTITNNGTYTLEYSILEIAPPDFVNAMSGSQAPRAPEAKSQPQQAAPEIEVEPQLLANLDRDEATGYLIYFREQPDLSPAFEMDWIERGRFVVAALQDTAKQSQERVRAYLDAQGADYKAFWIDNIISVRASNRMTFNGLLEFAEIEALRAHRNPILYEPVDSAPAASEAKAAEPNISHVGADQVWSEFGVTGEGIVVANIDTGVRYTHEALVNQYRGNLGSGTFDHNHNWWDPELGGSDLVPNDWHNHGSHTMGTILGNDGGANQIGMAPGATWLACQAFESGDDELLECGEFMAAPWDLTGANPDPDLRPHIINNSWGDCLQYADDWYDDTINAWHALGIYPVFSNGNASNCYYPEPPGCNTVGNPARSGNVTGVGSTGRDNGQYATHSNWGPTDDPDTVNPSGYPDLKPQVLAPGVSIRSAYMATDSSYGTMGGTSMSSPHVVGLVALMWSAAPCLVGDYATTETIIEQTATPIPYASNCGGEGPGNVPNYAAGWGEINAYDAVQEAMNYCGTDWLSWVETVPVSGTVETEQVVEVTFTCTSTATQEAQPLEGILQVRHNDPCEEPVEIDLTFYCISQNPIPNWEKEVWINGSLAGSVPGPHVVRPSDTVTIVDRVGAVYSETISAELTETWDESLVLVGYDNAGVGSVIEGDQTLTWDLDGVAPNALYAITKTFEVQYGDWTTDLLTESLTIDNALEQLPDVVITFNHHEPAMTLDKDGPAMAHDGDVMQMTLTIVSDGHFYGEAELIDTLPTGLTYAGNLTASHGEAWEDAGVIYWTSYTTTERIQLFEPQVDVIVDGSFEAGTPNPYWNEASTNFGTPLCTVASCGGTGGGTGPRTGTWWSWFGGATSHEVGSVDQDVTIPAGAATLSFWLEIPATDVAGSLEVNIDGNPVFSVTEADGGSYNPYTEVSLDVSTYADGGLHNLAFESIEEGTLTGVTNFMVEDVVLDVLQGEPMPSVVTITFDVMVSGDPGTVIRNSARLDWGDDWCDDIHDITMMEVEDWFLYLPLVFRDF